MDKKVDAESFIDTFSKFYFRDSVKRKLTKTILKGMEFQQI